MADQHIVLTDTTDRVLPLAWSVAGGTIVSNSVNITNSIGTTTANVAINNAVVTMNNSTITVDNTNTSFNNTGITINSTNNVANVAFSDTSINSSNSTTLAANEVISITANNVSVGSPNNVTLSSPNINTTGMLFSVSAGSVSFSTGNFTVSGPANFTALTNFNSAVGFNSICTFNNTTVHQSNFISNLPYTEISTNGTKTSQSNMTSQESNNITTVGTIVDSNTAFVGQSKFSGVVDSDKLAFNTLNFIDKSNVIYTQTVGTTVSITTSQTIPTKIVEMTITDALTVDSNTILELACAVIAVISGNIGSVFVQLSTNTKNYNLHYVGTSINSNIRFAKLLDTDSPDIQPNPSSISFSPNELKVSIYVTPSVTLSVPTTNFTLTVYQTKDVSTISGGGTDLTNILTPYSNANTYVINDLVYYNDYLYKCNTAITTPEDFDSSKWTQTTITTELSTILKFISSLQNLNNIQF
jgi:hypothetical protein